MASSPPFHLHECVRAEAILCQLEAGDKEDAIGQLIDALVLAKTLTKPKAAKVRAEVLEREAQASTGIGRGVGIPHAKSEQVKGVLLAIGRIPGGIDFGAVDGERVRIVLLLVSPASDNDAHLAAMRKIVGIVRDSYQCKRLLGCTTPESFLGLLKELDGPRK